MTTADLLALIWRWRLLLPLGVLLTGVAVLHVRDAPPVYWGQTELRVGPSASDASSGITSSSSGLIAMAGLVVREVDRGDPPAVSDSASLPGLGVRDGWQLRLPNTGGQWATNFNQPVIDVQVVGATPQAVRAQVAALTVRVGRELDRLQAQDGVPAASRMLVHADVVGYPVLKMAGSRVRAEVVTVLLGVWATLAAVLGAETVARAVRRGRRLDLRGWRRGAPLVGVE